ncbi:unnamed protein product [Periconia digitata]|uniref:S-adenosyl-L-methionine-dependent methyltransferase n=1 Tax=Periconia digitata TaxID=1303443 RepID=A0A9W4XSB4_9PLEO|nr:unnamed protein product [Periconia digitata]
MKIERSGATDTLNLKKLSKRLEGYTRMERCVMAMNVFIHIVAWSCPAIKVGSDTKLQSTNSPDIGYIAVDTSAHYIRVKELGRHQCSQHTILSRRMAYDEPYWLGRASAEQQRLIKQHYTWTKSIGYLLHPSIASALPSNAQIADVGTGTGIWLSELSKTSPSTHQFFGYDISDAQFLPSSSLPSNVTLSLGDFKKPFPSELHGKFDVVNIRLIIISMGPGIWESTLRHVVQLLKPGGTIIWTEGNFFVARGFRGSDPASTPGHALTKGQMQLNSRLTKRFGYNWPPNGWRALFEEAGLEKVEEDVLSTDRLPELRRDFTEIGIGAVFGALGNMAGAGEEEGFWSAGEVGEKRKEAVDDMESGAYLRWDIHVSVGSVKGNA